MRRSSATCLLPPPNQAIEPFLSHSSQLALPRSQPHVAHPRRQIRILQIVEPAPLSHHFPSFSNATSLTTLEALKLSHSFFLLG